MRKGVSNRIQFVYAILFVIIILCTVLVSYMSSSQRLEQEVIHSNLNMLDQINKRIESALGEIDRTMIHYLNTRNVQMYFSSPRTLNPDYLLEVSHTQRQISSLKSAHPSIDSIYMYSKPNEMVLSEDFHDPMEEVHSATWIKEYLQSPSYYIWTDRPQSPEGGQHRDTISLIRYYPVAEKPEYRTGVIAVNIRESSLSTMFSDLQFSGQGNVFVVDPDGTIVSHNNKAMIGQSVAAEPYGKDILSKNNSGWLHKETGKSSEWVFYAASEVTGWKVVYIVSQKQVNALFLTIRNILVVLAAGMILLSVLSVTVVNRRWFRPMEVFVGKLEQLLEKQDSDGGRDLAKTYDLRHLETRIAQVITNYSDAERQLHESKPALKLQVLFDIFTGHRTRYELAKSYFDHIGILSYPENFVVMTVELDNKSASDHENDINLYLYAICNIAEELIDQHDHSLQGAAVQINDFQVAILVSFPVYAPEANEKIAASFADSLRETVLTYCKKTISVGVGSSYRQFNEIKSSYQESQQLIHYKMVAGHNTTITRHEISEESRGLAELFELSEELLDSIKQADQALVADKLDSMFAIASRSNFTHQAMVQFALQLIFRSSKASGDHSVVEHLQDSQMQLEQSLERCETIAEMKTRLYEVISLMIAKLQEKRNAKRRSGDVIRDIICYIDEHYDNPDISLNYLADKYEISPSYLSKTFKDFTTTNFVDYVIRVRMDAARSLLTNPSLSVNQVAEQVGYANVTSFMRSFKKINGMTPSEFRQMHK